MLKIIKYKKKTLALIINYKKNNKRIYFPTPKYFTQQVGFINQKKNTHISPHTHTKFLRKIYKTSEVLIVKKGKFRVDFYKNLNEYLFSKIIKKNTIIILNEGSHGFKFLEKTELIEIKQGPFSYKIDKKRFNPIDEKKIKIKK